MLQKAKVTSFSCLPTLKTFLTSFLRTLIHHIHTEISMRHYKNISWPVHVHYVMKEASWVISNQRFPDILQEGFLFSPELLSSSGNRQNKDLTGYVRHM